MSAPSMRDMSRKEFEGRTTFEPINAGSLQRIADATELMAKGYTELIRERDYYEQRAKRLAAENERLTRQRSALRGAITRMKRQKRQEHSNG